jgi:hypothetical protein
MNETSGSFLDISGNNLHMSTTNALVGQGATSIGSGFTGVGLGTDFNGTTSYAAATDSNSFYPGVQGDFSFLIVCRADVIDATFRRIVGHDVATDGYALTVQTGAENGLRYERKGASASDICFVGAGTVIDTTYMVHVVNDVTAANTATLRIYVNGSQAAINGPGAVIADMANPSSTFALGRRDYDASRFFDGKIGMCAYWNSTALSAGQVSAHWAARNS